MEKSSIQLFVSARDTRPKQGKLFVLENINKKTENC
jgi:hypothetical protein